MIAFRKLADVKIAAKNKTALPELGVSDQPVVDDPETVADRQKRNDTTGARRRARETVESNRLL